MRTWHGAAAVVVNKNDELLMVKQGTPDEEKVWSIPSGGKEGDETFEACCMREVQEETGYEVDIDAILFEKKTVLQGYSVIVHYFSATIVGGEMCIQDPDGLIYDIAWKSADDLKELALSYPDDLKVLLDMIDAGREKRHK